MNIDEFNRVFDEVKSAKPLWLEGEMEPKASDEAISDAEIKLGINLPGQFIEFIQSVGAGYFGFTNVFSVNTDSEWYLLDIMDQYSFPKDFIPVSDDETGGYYGFLVKDKKICGDNVYYWHSSEGLEPAMKYETFYDYLVEVALKK